MDISGTLTTRLLAERLVTSVPRIHRAVARGLITPTGHDLRGGLLFDADSEFILLALWGRVPQALATTLSRPEAFVLAALARRPYGLRSGRLVAATSGLSPTAATHALASLETKGLVEQLARPRNGGALNNSTVHTIQWRSHSWHKIAPEVAKVRLPVPSERQTQSRDAFPKRLPHRFWRLFTDVNAASLRPSRHGDFIIRRILASNDLQGLAWMAASFPPAAIGGAIASPRAVEPRARPFAQALAGAR